MVNLPTYLWKITLNSVDITDYVLKNSYIEKEFKNYEGNLAKLWISDSVDSVVIPSNSQRLIISRGTVSSTEYYEFRGTVKKTETDFGSYKITARDDLDKLKRKFNKSYDKNIDVEAGVYKDIFLDIIDEGGLTGSSAPITSTFTAKKFVSKQQTRLEKCRDIAKILNCFFYHDYNNDYIRLEPKGFQKYNTVLSTSSNIFTFTRWKNDITRMINKLTIEGASKIDTRKVTYSGDDSTTEFSFDYTPISTNCTIDGTLQLQGAEDTDIDYDYIVDAERKTFTFTTAPTSGQSIVMTYTAKVPYPVIGTAPDSIEFYNGLIQDDVINLKDIVTVQDAKDKLQSILDQIKFGELSTSFYTDQYQIIPGMSVDFENPRDTTYDDEYIVTKTRIEYPSGTTALTLGNTPLKLTEYLQRIQEIINLIQNDNPDLTGLLLHLITFSYVYGYDFQELTYDKIKVCDSYIAGHPITDVAGIGGILNDMTDNTDWTAGTSVSLSDEAVITLNDENTIQLDWTGNAGLGTMTSTPSSRDLSDYSGVSSGSASQGTIGLWIYIEDGDSLKVSDIKVRVGNDSSNYIELDTLAYKSVDGYENWDDLSFELQNGWNYLVAQLPDGNITGTLNWTTIDYYQILTTFTENITVYYSYFTISESNYISAYGVGSRKMTVSTTTR